MNKIEISRSGQKPPGDGPMELVWTMVALVVLCFVAPVVMYMVLSFWGWIGPHLKQKSDELSGQPSGASAYVIQEKSLGL